MDNTILAIDLGKYKCVACILGQDTGEFRFASFDTSRAELRKLIARQQPNVVVIEACLLAGWVHDLCGELGVRFLVANTASEAWKFKHLKRKTDKDDALRLAQLQLLGQLPTVTLPSSSVRQWRSLIALRQTLVGRRVAVQNRIRALFVAQGLPAPRGAKAWSEIGLAGMTLQAKSLAACAPDELWRGLLELSLTEYRQVCDLISQAETRLDALGMKNADVILLQTAPAAMRSTCTWRSPGCPFRIAPIDYWGRLRVRAVGSVAPCWMLLLAGPVFHRAASHIFDHVHRGPGRETFPTGEGP